jgi:hypothetical protein
MTEYAPKLKLYRKRRKHKGRDWEPELDKLEQARKHDKIYCRGCRKFRRWRDLYTKLQRVGKKQYQLVWFCEKCDNAVHVQDYDLRKNKGTK